jgi:hypothetical protein
MTCATGVTRDAQLGLNVRHPCERNEITDDR